MKRKLPGWKFDYITLLSTLEHVGIVNRRVEDLDLDADAHLLRWLGEELLKRDGAILVTIPYVASEVMENQKIYGDKEIDDLVNGSRDRLGLGLFFKID